VLYVNQLIISF